MKVLMKAKAVAILTTFLMVFAMMPLVAFGEDDIEGTRAAHTHDGISFTEWTETTSLPNTSDNYYLTEDVTIGSTWEVPSGETTLCLNGHGIKFTGEKGSVIYVGDGNTLNIMDCNSENLTHKFTVTNGLATVDDSATGEDVETFSGGYITGGNCNTSDNNYKRGGGIYNNGILNMLGGTIIGNQADHSAGVENRGTFNMSGNALVEYNKAGATGGVGNRLNNKFTMSGNATIRHNTSKSNGYGGGVTNYGDFYVSGTPVISENTMGNGVNGNVYAGRTGDYYFPIRVMGKLESGASIGVKRYDNTKGIIAVPGESYTITDSDKARFTADDARYEVNLIAEGDNAGKLELKDKEYDLWVGGTRVTYANRNDIPATYGTKTGTASFDPETYTLTLDNYTYTGAGLGTIGIFVQNYDNSDIKLTIILKGTNTITISKDSYAGNEGRICTGILVFCSLEIKGSNTDQLNIHAKGVTNNNAQSVGINIVHGDLTINGGIVNAVAYACNYYSTGIFIEEGNAYINGGTLIAKGDSVSEEKWESTGIKTNKLCIGKNIQAVTAIGETKAIRGMVKNETPGKGWTNVAGTGEAAPIEKYSDTGDGYNFIDEEPYSTYKKVLFEPVHEHSFTYAAGTGDNANKITATCEGNLDCPEGYKNNPITITLNKPTNLTYNGTPKEAGISGYPTTTVKNLAAEPAIKYFKPAGAGSTQTIGEALDDAPVNFGNYVAQMTWGGATASAPFSIAKAPLTITAKDQTYTYNGQTQGEGDPTYDDPAVIAEKVTVEGLQSPDQLANVTLTGSAKDVGEYPIEVTGYRIEDSAGNNVAENYIVTTVPGKLTIKENKQVAKTSGTPLTTMKAGDTSMTIAWQKVTGAEGYDIFFSRCDGKGKTTAKKAQTINGNSTFAWTRSGLTAGVSYKAYVKAYVMKNGSKQYVAASPLMHAYTKGYTKRYTNAKSVKVKKTKVSIKKGKTFKIKAKVKKLKKGKKLMPTKHELKLRYLSTDSSIAIVSKKGKIKGVKAGTCYVYAYAHNGVFKKIKVTVK